MTMYRIYIPALDLDIQHNDIATLYRIVEELKSDQYAIQKTGWVDMVESDWPFN